MLFTSRAWARAGALTLASLAGTAQGVNFVEIPSPNLDLSALGRVALTGDFDAISLYSYEGQNENAFTTNGSQALLTQMPNGLFRTLETSDGFIFSACPFVRKDGTMAGIVVGGNFTSLGSTQAQGVALWDPTSNGVTPLPGLNGSVKAVWCEQQTDSVYVGGTFHGGNSTNAIVWIGEGEWNNMPFEGFNGPINAIAQVPGSSNVVFAGQFSTVGNSSVTTGMFNEQTVNLGSSDISGTVSTSQSGLSDPRNIVCKSGNQDGPGNTWLLADSQKGVWKTLSDFKYQPTKLRLRNTQYQGRGTKSFSLRAFPQNGQMNLTYTDPTDGQNKSCIQDCPLSNDPKLQYQEFTFVNVIDMGGFQVEINDWYGPGGGLDGIEVLQEANYVYANSTFNEPGCSNSTTPSNSTATGPWQNTPSGQNSADYLTANLQGPGVNANSAAVTFYPDIRQSGTYLVEVTTPGCQLDGTCQQRGNANVTAQYSASGQVQQVNIPQTNDFEKIDQIYSNYVDLPTSSFRPYVKIQPLADQNDSINLVALRVKFTLMQANGSSSSGEVTTVSSTSRLNGIYEYNPNNATVDPNFSDSPINVAGANLSDNALITSMATVGNSLYIAGNFSTDKFSNIFAYSNGASNSLQQGGLNDVITSMIAWGNIIFMGGNFTNTKTGDTSLAHGVVSYDTANNVWIPLGGGVNGRVDAVVPLQLNLTAGQSQSCITVNGQFTQVLPGKNTKGFNTTDGFAIWVPAYNDWLQNLNIAQPAITGQLTYSTNYSNVESLLAGTISSQGMAIEDVVALSTNSGNASISSLGLQEASVAALGQNEAQFAQRLQPNISGAVTGLFVVNNGLNMSVIGGNFETTASNGSTIRNLAFINTASNGTNTITGVAAGLTSNSTFLSMAQDTSSSILYAGGIVTGQVNGNNVNGLILWDLSKSAFASGQPPALGGENVSVNSITVRPKSSDVYVGGGFSMAGALPCPGLCLWSSTQWKPVGTGFNGVVNAQMWQGNDKLLVGGNFTNGGNHTYLANLNANAGATENGWSTPNGTDQVPGPVSVLTPANSDNSQYWLAGRSTNGSAYIQKWDGNNFRSIQPQFGASSTIRGLSVLSLQASQSHAQTDLLDPNYVLLITGSLDVPGFGNASAVLYNGSDVTPFILSNSGNGPGSISQLISESPQTFTTGKGSLALGFVVLIALAISLALIFILVVIGMLLERWRRRREGYRPAPQNYVEKTANMSRIPPDQLLGNLSRGNEGPSL